MSSRIPLLSPGCCCPIYACGGLSKYGSPWQQEVHTWYTYTTPSQTLDENYSTHLLQLRQYTYTSSYSKFRKKLFHGSRLHTCNVCLLISLGLKIIKLQRELGSALHSRLHNFAKQQQLCDLLTRKCSWLQTLFLIKCHFSWQNEKEEKLATCASVEKEQETKTFGMCLCCDGVIPE